MKKKKAARAWERGNTIKTRAELEEALKRGKIWVGNELVDARIVRVFSEDSIKMSLKNLRFFWAD